MIRHWSSRVAAVTLTLGATCFAGAQVITVQGKVPLSVARRAVETAFVVIREDKEMNSRQKDIRGYGAYVKRISPGYRPKMRVWLCEGYEVTLQPLNRLIPSGTIYSGSPSPGGNDVTIYLNRRLQILFVAQAQ